MQTKKKRRVGNGASQPTPAVSEEVLNGYYDKMGTPTALQEITQSILEASDDHEVLSILSEIITISAEHAQYIDLSIEENADRAAALRVSAEEKRVKLYNALVNVLGLKWANKINLEQFNPDIPFNGFVIERYPTTDDEGKGPDHMSCRNDNNGTIKALLWTLPRWCATEERRRENPDAEPANFIPKHQGVIDLYATALIKEDSDKVARAKKERGEKPITVKDQNKKIAKKADMSVEQLSAINYHLMGLQFVLFRLENGRAAPALICSKEAAMCMFALSTSSTYGALVVDKPLVRGHRSPHGQNWLTGAQMAYKDTTKQALCNALGSYYSDVEQRTMFENTRVAFEFPKKVSQEAIADMIEQRRKSGRLAATRIYEAREFINALLDSGVCLDEEEAMAVLATWCSASHNLFKGWTFCQSLIVLRMAFVAYANKHKIEDIFCEAVLDELDDGMKALFESTSATALENTNNEAVSKEGVFAKLAAQYNGWKFTQALDPLRKALVKVAGELGIENIFSVEVADKLVGDMKELFKSTAETKLVNTNGEAVGPERLLVKIAAQHMGSLKGMDFCQKLTLLCQALVLTAAANGIGDIFSLETVNKIDDEGMKTLFESTAATALVNTNGQAVGPKGLLLKLAAKYKMSTQVLYPLRMALVSTATANGIDNIFSLEVVSKIKDRGMKALFESTAKTVLENTNGQAIGPDRLLLKLASQHTGWTFCQALIELRKAFVFSAKQHNIYIDDCEAVLEKLDDGMQKLFKTTAETTLVSTNNQAIGKKRLFLKLVAPILECYNKHLPKIKKYAKIQSNIVTLDDSRKVLVVPGSGEYRQTYEYLAGLRQTHGDNDTWQWDRLLKEVGISMKASCYREAIKKQIEDEAAKQMQPKKKNGHVAGNDAPSIEDDEFF